MCNRRILYGINTYILIAGIVIPVQADLGRLGAFISIVLSIGLALSILKNS